MTTMNRMRMASCTGPRLPGLWTTFQLAIAANTRKTKPRISCHRECMGLMAAGRTCFTNLPACLPKCSWRTTSSYQKRKGRCAAPPNSTELRDSGGADATRFARVPRKSGLYRHVRDGTIKGINPVSAVRNRWPCSCITVTGKPARATPEERGRTWKNVSKA